MRIFLVSWLSAVLLWLSTLGALAGSKILDQSVEDMGTFYWTSSPESADDIKQIQPVIDKQDPYQIFYFAFRGLRYAYKSNNSEALDAVLSKLDYMIDKYEPAERTNGGVRWKYGHAFNEIPPGWWSGMDGFFGPLTLYAAWEVTGNEKYKDVAIATAKLTLRSPSKGGNLWRHGNGCWVSEFAWPGITFDKEYHVVNGQLFGLHALYLLAEVSGDQELKEAYTCARKGSEYQANRAKELNKGEWPWYRTNPPTITPINYFLIEMVDYATLAKVTGDNFFDLEANRRRELFANRYPFVVTHVANKLHLMISFIGAPHPYESQTYGVEILCHRGGDEVRFIHQNQMTETDTFSDRYTLDKELPWMPDSCDYNIRRGDFTFHVFKQTSFPAMVEYTKYEARITPSADAIEWDGHRAKISPAFQADKVNLDNSFNLEGRLNIDIPWNGNELLAMVLNPDVDQTVQFYIEDDKDQYAWRVYPEAKGGCDNIVIISKEGFENFDKIEKHLHRIILRLDTSRVAKDYFVGLSDVKLLNGPVDIRNYLSDHPRSCFWSETFLPH